MLNAAFSSALPSWDFYAGEYLAVVTLGTEDSHFQQNIFFKPDIVLSGFYWLFFSFLLDDQYTKWKWIVWLLSVDCRAKLKEMHHFSKSNATKEKWLLLEMEHLLHRGTTSKPDWLQLLIPSVSPFLKEQNVQFNSHWSSNKVITPNWKQDKRAWSNSGGGWGSDVNQSFLWISTTFSDINLLICVLNVFR